ncbi:phytase [Paecilomyces variotii No. 5]|uniref:Phytase A n=1 Tax=Byssochlamys spectabilis (strain No. 5 / NBRC 109023) TaxID=1356009 RepID=V5FPP1_BYSSN|nr:phytase [Paecilomyces variotii No. 5]
MAILSFLLTSVLLARAGGNPLPNQRCNTVHGGYTCYSQLATEWGQYAPFFSLASESPISPEIPEGCQVTVVQALSRHGARYPTASKNKVYKALIDNIQTIVTSLKGDYAFLKTYNYTFGSDDLTNYGELEMYQAGIAFYNRYERLAKDNVPFIRSSSSERVVESSEKFISGFQATKDMDLFSDKSQDAPTANVILEEGSTFNNTLNHGVCPKFESSNLADNVQDGFANIFIPKIKKRVQCNLPGISIDTDDVISLMDLCTFDTVYQTDNASKLSPFCKLFTHEEWVQYNYYQSLGKYYGYGAGNPLGPAQGIGFVNELIARLTRTPVQDHTSTNSTLDSNPATFPLNATLYADFSHDNGLTPIFFALGLYNGTKPLSTTEVESIFQTDGYSAAWSVPYAARSYVEMMTCAYEEQPLVRILVNERVIPLHGCKTDNLGRCTLNEFVDGLSFARSGGNWETCFE